MPESRHVWTEQERRWLEENREAIASINAIIARHGLCADRLRYRREIKLRSG
jgi:post-segregation antitoxin (ccd killing protein)